MLWNIVFVEPFPTLDFVFPFVPRPPPKETGRNGNLSLTLTGMLILLETGVNVGTGIGTSTFVVLGVLILGIVICVVTGTGTGLVIDIDIGEGMFAVIGAGVPILEGVVLKLNGCGTVIGEGAVLVVENDVDGVGPENPNVSD